MEKQLYFAAVFQDKLRFCLSGVSLVTWKEHAWKTEEALSRREDTFWGGEEAFYWGCSKTCPRGEKVVFWV